MIATTLAELKQAVDQAIARANGKPVEDYPLLLGGKPVEVEIGLDITENHVKPTIEFYDSY